MRKPCIIFILRRPSIAIRCSSRYRPSSHGRSASPIPNRARITAAFIDGQLAGQLAVMLNQRVRRRHVATFGIGVDPRYHGKGVGSRLMQAMIDLCDNWAAIERIELTVFTDNPAAMALYRKFGFEIEGTSRAYAMRDGVLVDAYHMARLRSGQPHGDA